MPSKIILLSRSPPARVAWIEIGCWWCSKIRKFVATREGGVDRNRVVQSNTGLLLIVATREGGVDRNNPEVIKHFWVKQSPPARVAWIEIKLIS